MQEWINYMSKSYIDLVGPKVKIFKMDKTATQLDEFYGEAKTGRIYLPPFEIRSIYNANKWVGFLDSGGIAEKEEELEMHINFNNMVSTITELKNKNACTLTINFTGRGISKLEKLNNVMNFYVNNVVVLSLALSSTDNSSVRKVTQKINAMDGWSSSFTGKNDLSINLIEFNKTSFVNRSIEIYSIDHTYENITDIIEVGDVLLTERNRLYEINESKPAGDFGWNYTLWFLQLELASPDRFNLPGNYIDQIKKSSYGLNKIDME